MLSTCMMFLSLPLSVYLKLLSDLMHSGVSVQGLVGLLELPVGRHISHVFSPHQRHSFEFLFSAELPVFAKPVKAFFNL